jgi:hypothetical protein
MLSITSQYHAGSKCDYNQWICTYRVSEDDQSKVKTTTSKSTASPRPHTYCTRAHEYVAQRMREREASPC